MSDSEVDDILSAGNIYYTGEEIQERLAQHGYQVVLVEDDVGQPYVPNENTVRIPIEDWRRLNSGHQEKEVLTEHHRP
jgi:hypothetical protein